MASPLDEQSTDAAKTAAVASAPKLAHLPSAVQERVQNLLEGSPDPVRAAHYLEELESRFPGSLFRFASERASLPRLITIFGYSRFLAEEVLQHPEWVSEITDLYRPFTTSDFTDQLNAFLKPKFFSASALSLFRRKQLLRIVLRDVMNVATLSEITEELSNLADAILERALSGVIDEVAERFGHPIFVQPDGSKVVSGFCVLALGKLGGRELNYSSDIDLLFLFGGNGETGGATSITNREFHKRVATRYTEVLSTYTAEGMCYRVDLRLRPEGRYGEVCLSLDGAKEYYAKRARDWELQMLIKARVAAGDAAIGTALLDSVQQSIYSTTLDFSAIETMSATRERIGEKLAAKRRRPGELDVKLARGGIRDIEFLVQCLQRLHGGREPWVRHGGTLLALSRLLDKNLLSGTEYSRLMSAYQYLRNLEHRLQFEDDQQTHVLPVDEKEMERLSRRMPSGFTVRPASPSVGAALLQQLNEHLESVQLIYDRVVHAQQPLYYSSTVPVEKTPSSYESERTLVTPPSNIIRSLDQSAPGLAERFAQRGMRRGQRAFEHFLDRVMEDPSRIDTLNGNPAASDYLLQIFEASPYFSEQLIRNPELVDEVLQVANQTNYRWALNTSAGSLDDATSLRRFYRREIFRIEAASICLPEDVFISLDQTSSLADFVISRAYRIALDQAIAHAKAHQSPEHPFSPPAQDMMVIALGRLGMREFDLASDADLVFIIPDSESEREKFWTRVAEHLIDIITAYTIDGAIFSIDTRLRPNGREGKLLQTESGMKEYFSSKAEAWEGIAYMKARAVAGDLERATRFLTDLQQVDWRLYGQSGRSKQSLHQMRLRLEREQSAANPLKAGRGGYYDADFALMFLRLKGAGLFFKTLNTPERIDIVEKMGHLDRPDAEFLRHATTFYRALDHGLRIVTGHAEGSLPGAKSELDMVTELVTRWMPNFPKDTSLDAELAHTQEQMRRMFERVFA